MRRFYKIKIYGLITIALIIYNPGHKPQTASCETYLSRDKSDSIKTCKQSMDQVRKYLLGFMKWNKYKFLLPEIYHLI